ncbi:hypothetical protein [Nocardia sp. MH4]|uniref:hypothetical protein n=1 Tax=Nocardia sp. MH4 TaxID=1768677 RepID=UPI001C4EC9C7|nr:hypothetical protein [Nocardia sp. MH4]
MWHEIQIRTITERLGYRLSKTIVFGEFTADPVVKLIAAVAKAEADAVVMPSAAHVGGDIPEELVAVADVITVSPEETFARRLANIFDPPALPGEGDRHGHSHPRDRVPAAGGRDLADIRRDLSPLTYPSELDRWSERR